MNVLFTVRHIQLTNTISLNIFGWSTTSLRLCRFSCQLNNPKNNFFVNFFWDNLDLTNNYFAGFVFPRILSLFNPPIVFECTGKHWLAKLWFDTDFQCWGWRWPHNTWMGKSTTIYVYSYCSPQLSQRISFQYNNEDR